MKCSERVDLHKNNGIVLSQHPAVIVTVGISNVTKDLKAGSIIFLSKDGDWNTKKTNPPQGVLLEDVKKAESGEKVFASVLIHGCVNVDRLELEEFITGGASKGLLVADLIRAGIYPVQSFDE